MYSHVITLWIIYLDQGPHSVLACRAMQSQLLKFALIPIEIVDLSILKLFKIESKTMYDSLCFFNGFFKISSEIIMNNFYYIF